MATDWRSPPDSVPTACSVSRMSMPILSSSSLAIRFAFGMSIHRNGPNPRRGSSPSQKLRHTDISGTTARSWYTVAMPRSRASRGEANVTSSPSRRTLPSLGLVHTGEDLDERRLAGAVVAEHARDLTGPHRRGDPLEGDDVAVVLAEVANLEHRRATVAPGRALLRRARSRHVDASFVQITHAVLLALRVSWRAPLAGGRSCCRRRRAAGSRRGTGTASSCSSRRRGCPASTST